MKIPDFFKTDDPRKKLFWDRFWILFVAIFSAGLIYDALDVHKTIIHTISPDTYTYIESAELLYNSFLPHPTRPIGYAFISGIPKLFSPTVRTEIYLYFSCMINVSAWIGSILYFHKTLLLFLNPRASKFMSLLAVFFMGSMVSVFFMLTESIVLFLLSIITYYLFCYYSSKKNHHIPIVISLVNILVLFRPGFIYLAITASVIMLYFLLSSKKGRLSKSYISFWIASVTLVTLQISMMYRVYGQLVPSYIDKYTWYNYLGAQSHARANDISVDDVMKERMRLCGGLSYPEMSRISTEDFILQVRRHPKIIIQQWAGNILENCTSGSNLLLDMRKEKNPTQDIILRFLYGISRLQNICFVILLLCSTTIIFVKNEFKNRSLFFLNMLILYVITTSGLSFLQGDRFHIVLYPSILILFLYQIRNVSGLKISPPIS